MKPYLLAHPNPNGQHFYTARRGTVLACVIHITAGLQGRPTGADSSAERTARYAATTDRQVSWHSGSDRDSNLILLPDTHTAFHVQGYNSRTIGHEISKTDVTWADEDPDWVTDTLIEAAICLRPRLARLQIPLRQATKAELDRAILRGEPPVGLIGHAVLDPDRRRDPGPDFPWKRFLRLLATPSLPASTPPAPTPAPVPPEPVQEDDMSVIVKDPNGPQQFVTDFITKRHIADPAELAELKRAGLKTAEVTTDTLARIPEVRA